MQQIGISRNRECAALHGQSVNTMDQELVTRYPIYGNCCSFLKGISKVLHSELSFLNQWSGILPTLTLDIQSFNL